MFTDHLSLFFSCKLSLLGSQVEDTNRLMLQGGGEDLGKERLRANFMGT